MAVYYHLFKKTVTLKSGKQIKKWYYWYYSSDKTQVRKSCKGCVSKAEAQAYIDSLPPPAVCSATVSRIAKDMYIPGSVHYERRRQFGKSISPRTMLDCRAYVKYIIDVFGDRRIEDLRVSEIQQYLLNCNKSGSWKNRYQEIFCEIYDEAVWQGISVSKPTFIKFKRNSKRQSVLSTEEYSQISSTTPETFRIPGYVEYESFCTHIKPLALELIEKNRTELNLNHDKTQNEEPVKKSEAVQNERIFTDRNLDLLQGQLELFENAAEYNSVQHDFCLLILLQKNQNLLRLPLIRNQPFHTADKELS
ncbi:hypothetical protein [Treponema brennaborense]|uniref:Uncharacterized protein n=1 Tax=Treponema brennaborense (strain DSM 12168 / CIP 105900 / DD5/3) TaxID=906968 RepID=F4LII4_TREBD|nr:hypothetical protein [Treponema brennaborense]AEE17209.1 hypothetical protein Trebr_1787 [Treponema brennaborense DSM 12168]